MNIEEEYVIIQRQINEYVAKKINVPKQLYQRQFDIVKSINDTFEKSKIEDISDYATGIRQNMMLKYFGEKIGKPVEAYKNKIRNYYFKLTGEKIKEEDMDINI